MYDKNLDTKKFGLVKNCAYKNLNLRFKKKSIYFIDKKEVDERSESGAGRNTTTHIHHTITHTNNTTLQKTSLLKNHYSHMV